MPLLKRPQMVLLDVDGTLVDSVPDLAYCVDEMMRFLDLPARGQIAVRQWVGNGVERLVERALVNDLNGSPELALKNRALPVFMQLYAENTSRRSRLYDGVLSALDDMREAGLSLGCVTNKAARFTQTLLSDMGILDRFETVISGDTLREKKPHPMPLLYAAEQLHTTPAQSMMVGDSKNDIKAARAAGFPVVCVSYGYNHGEDIRSYSPDAVIDCMSEFMPLLAA